MYSTLYSTMYITVYCNRFNIIYMRQGGYISLTKKPGSPATRMSVYIIMCSKIYSIKYNTNLLYIILYRTVYVTLFSTVYSKVCSTLFRRQGG